MTPADAAAKRPKRLDSFEAVFQVAQLTVRRTFKGWRALASLAVVVLPAALGLLVRAGVDDPVSQERFFYGMISTYHFGIAVPFVALIFATAFPWPEAEEGTLTYWFTSPIPRWTVLLGRWIAALLIGMLVLSISVFAVGLPVATRPEAETANVMRASLTATLLAYPAYLALFQLVATALRHGLVFGVIFILVENLISVLSGTIVKLTLIFYVRSQVFPVVPKGSRGLAQKAFHVAEPASNTASLAVFAGVTVIGLLVSLLVVRAIEYRGRTSQPG